ncbi:Ff.00g085420.m01.CDS01 [Fusarium sp. VM40]|nr:Ff.00g085420.m01.CDS01 [Fusarium sp. VM40]
MHTSTFISSSLLALAATVQSFKFTGPNTSEAIDLSTEVTITWSEGNRSVQDKWRNIDLTWFSQPTELRSFEFELASGLNLSDEQFKFTPKNTIKTLQPFADQLSKNKAFSFKATLRNGTGPEDVGAVVSSSKYYVIGLQKTTNAAAAVGFGWSLIGGMAVVCLAVI